MTRKQTAEREDLQVDAVGRILAPVELEPEYSRREPVGQRIDVFAAREENQQSVEDIQRCDRDDDRWNPKLLDEDRVDGAQRAANADGDGEDADPVRAIGVRHRKRHILRHRCRRGERDVDAAGDQHHEQPERENTDEGVGGQQVKQVLHGQELGGRHAQAGAERKDDDQQPELVAAPKPAE